MEGKKAVWKDDWMVWKMVEMKDKMMVERKDRMMVEMMVAQMAYMLESLKDDKMVEKKADLREK